MGNRTFILKGSYLVNEAKIGNTSEFDFSL